MHTSSIALVRRAGVKVAHGVESAVLIEPAACTSHRAAGHARHTHATRSTRVFTRCTKGGQGTAVACINAGSGGGGTSATCKARKRKPRSTPRTSLASLKVVWPVRNVGMGGRAAVPNLLREHAILHTLPHALPRSVGTPCKRYKHRQSARFVNGRTDGWGANAAHARRTQTVAGGATLGVPPPQAGASKGCGQCGGAAAGAQSCCSISVFQWLTIESRPRGGSGPFWSTLRSYAFVRWMPSSVTTMPSSAPSSFSANLQKQK